MTEGYSRHVLQIETDRLLLRRHRLTDFADSFAMWSHPDVVRFISGRPSTEEEAWGRLHRYVGHWELLGFGYWVVTDRTTGQFVGEVGFADFKRAIVPSFDGAPEAGWALAPAFHGRGYATEALTGALGWLEEHIRPARTVCMIDETNQASVRVADKVGYRVWTKSEYKGMPSTLYERASNAARAR